MTQDVADRWLQAWEAYAAEAGIDPGGIARHRLLWLRVPCAMSVFRWAVVVSNVAMSGLLLAMAAPQVRRIAAQMDSGYVPDDYWINIALVILPFVLAVLILWGLVVWSRGSRRLLVATDAVVTLACWSVLVLYLFVNDLPIVALALSPIALILAAVVPPAQTGPRSSAEPSG